MKLAFSTLGCPEWGLAEIIAAARDNGYDGIEFRGLLGEIELTNVPEFSPAQIATTRIRLADAGLQAACLGSSIQIVASVVSEVDRHAVIAHTERYLDLAREVNAPYVRVFCGAVPATIERSLAMDKAAETLRRLGDFAQQRDIAVVVETHDAFIRSEELMELIRLTDHPAVQVLWDVHHPYRMAGESIAHSMHYLNGHVRHTHIKDSVQHDEGDGYTYVLLGRGDVPIPAALRALHAAGYDGYLSLEWEKRWVPSLEPPEVAFPQYAEQMRTWLGAL